MMLVVCAMMFGAGLLALDKFDDGLTGTAASATANVTVSIGNFAGMFPTIGTILGVAVLIVAVLGAFMWAFGKFGR